MSDRAEAIRHFEEDYFPNLTKGVLSADIVKAMKEDWKAIVAEPEVGLAVAVPTPMGLPPEIPPVSFDELEKAVEFVGRRDEPEPVAEPVTVPAKRGKLKL